jgi:hypothetical protein
MSNDDDNNDNHDRGNENADVNAITNVPDITI